jgi:hypothetical protein
LGKQTPRICRHPEYVAMQAGDYQLEP